MMDWASRRARLAPRAVRMAASRARPAARARERLARLTQRTRRTAPTAAIKSDEALAEIADHAFLQRNDGGVEVEIAGNLFADGGLYDVEFGLGAFAGDAGAQAGGGPEIEVAHADLEIGGFVADGFIDFEAFPEGAVAGLFFARELETRGQNAGDFKRLADRAGSCGRRWRGRPGSGGARASRRG